LSELWSFTSKVESKKFGKKSQREGASVMSLFENMQENHEEEIGGFGNCPLCKLERGEITQ